MQKSFGSLAVVSIISVLILGLFGCAPSVKIPVTRPAEINLTGVKRIAIGDIGGKGGNTLSDLITQRLFESGYFEILDRQNLDRMMREHKLNISGVVDENTAVSMGKLLGASALIFGDCNTHYRRRTKISKPYKEKKGGTYKYYYKYGDASVSTMLKVVDLQTGRILAVKNFMEKSSAETSEKNQWPEDPDRGSLIGKAINSTADRFMKMIAPYTEYVKVEFENPDIPESKTGINFAKAGQWDEALLQFKQATESRPDDAGAWFNLGLAYEYTYRFDQAIEALNRSNALKPSNTCIKEIGNCKELRAEQAKLKQQLEGRGN